MIGTVDLFFKRQKRERGEFPDVYQYEELPEKFKIQMVHIWQESLGKDYEDYRGVSSNRKDYEEMYSILVKELGVLDIGDREQGSIFNKISNYFLSESDIEICLSIIELFLWGTYTFYRNKYFFNAEGEKQINLVINEINERFKENGIGYQFENFKIIRIDSQYIHSEAVKPTLMLLNQAIYQGAQQEFLKAHEHYCHQRYQEAMVECLKAYESTLKIILKKRGWEYKDTDTADALTGKVMQKGLVPEYWLQYFKSLKNTLTAGVPTVRNKEAGHGQGDELKDIPDYLVAYVLHMTASAILFLIKAEQSLSN